MTGNALLPPPAVTEGGVIGIAALSGPVDPEALAAGRRVLESWGYRTRCADNLGGVDRGLFAGDDRARLDGFHRLLDDDEVEAVIFARGGHGILRLLSSIDWARVARRPRSFVGYSDVTPFLLEITSRLGWISFHGPMVAVDLARGLDAEEMRSLREALAGRWASVTPVEVLHRPDGLAGPVRGPLAGGCLSLLCSVVGTPLAPRFDRRLLLLEDVGEPVYRLDRMLAQLSYSGALRRVGALLAGQFGFTEASEADAWHELLVEWASRHGAVACAGLPLGHGRPNLTYPIGACAELDLGAGVLRVLEAE